MVADVPEAAAGRRVDDVHDLLAIEVQLLFPALDQHPAIGHQVAGGPGEPPGPNHGPIEQHAGGRQHGQRGQPEAGHQGLEGQRLLGHVGGDELLQRRHAGDDHAHGHSQQDRRERHVGPAALPRQVRAPGRTRIRRPQHALAELESLSQEPVISTRQHHVLVARDDGGDAVGRLQAVQAQHQAPAQRTGGNGPNELDVAHTRTRPMNAGEADLAALDAAAKGPALEHDVVLRHLVAHSSEPDARTVQQHEPEGRRPGAEQERGGRGRAQCAGHHEGEAHAHQRGGEHHQRGAPKKHRSLEPLGAARPDDLLSVSRVARHVVRSLDGWASRKV